MAIHALSVANVVVWRDPSTPGEQPFGQIGRLGEEEQVVGAQHRVGTDGLPLVQDRHDVDDRQVADRCGVLDCEPLRDQPAAVVTGHGEALVAETA